MNKKRVFYLLAFLIIMAAIIVPTVINSKHDVPAAINSNRGSEPLAETAAPGVGREIPPVTAGEGNEAKVAVETPTETPTRITSSIEDKVEPVKENPAVPANSSPVQNSPEQPGCGVGIAVVGIGGELLYPPATVSVRADNKWEITALGALDATGLPYAMKPMWPSFVDSISGQACKGVSGWMYMVNGEIPMHLADKHPVKEGDKVIWWYSESMDQEPPVWDKLKEQSLSN